MSEVILNQENFETTITGKDKPVLVDFWASWCGPCKMVGPIVEEIAKEMEGKAVVGKLNVDENQNIAQKYNVSAIPTIIIFKDGNEVERLVGMRQKEEYIDILNKMV